ncbi:MAG: N-acetyltransferase [Acidimicrobiales bacterium]
MSRSSSTPPRFVPVGFEAPGGLSTDRFRLEPLGPQHNLADLEAWTTSIEHIQRTPGFAGRDWPTRVLSLNENLADLEGHADDFEHLRGFTYTVIDPEDMSTVGCVYLYPSRRAGYDVDVSSWVRASRADLDRPLYETVSHWLASAWPWRAPDYAARP